MMSIKSNRVSKYQRQFRPQARDVNPLPDTFFRFGDIFRNIRLIVTVSLITAVLGILAALAVTPLYESNILIQIMRHTPLPGDPPVEAPAATEVEILRSRSIISGVVNTLRLDISAEPKLFPVLGAYMARTNKSLSEPGLFGHGGYVWGAERVTVFVFNVPGALLQKPFVLTAAGGGGFTLTQKELAIRLAGRINEVSKARTPYGDIEALVTDIRARPGAQFIVTKSPPFQVVERLRKSLAISESGKESNVIGVSLKGSNPEMISGILNHIGNEYVRQHLARKSAEATRAFSYYDQQLEESSSSLRKLDQRLAQVLRVHGTSDLNEESNTLAQQSVSLQAKLAEVEQRKVELSTRFLEQHPTMFVVNRHIQDLKRDLDNIEAKRKALAAAQQEIANLTRERQASSEIKMGLLNARQRLEAMTSSNDADVRMVDRAEVPIQPVTLKQSVMIALACLAGVVFGLVASILKNAIVARNSRRLLPRVRDQRSIDMRALEEEEPRGRKTVIL